MNAGGQAPRIVRQCCGVVAKDFDREYGSTYLPHKRSCPNWRPTVDWRKS